jgi:hypothetical protein
MKKVGTLFSGHRATTFINSILNAAYMMIILGRDYKLLRAKHTGDDILFSTNNGDLVDRVVKKVMRSRVRANPQKQGLGMECAEFLRCSFNKQGGIGYTARSISAFVCGNWTTENELGSGDYANAALQNLWTIENRCGHRHVSAITLKALQRRVPGLVLGHTTFKVGFGNSPVRMGKYTPEICKSTITSQISSDKKPTTWVSNATQDYLDNHVDHDNLLQAGITAGTLKTLMLEASYANSFIRDHQVTTHARGCVTSKSVITIGKWLKRQRGTLSSIFPLAQIKNQLGLKELRQLLMVYDGFLNADPFRQAWGEGTKSVNIIGHLPYGDARYLAGCVAFNCNLDLRYSLRL